MSVIEAKKKFRKLVTLIILLLVIIGGIVASLYFFKLKPIEKQELSSEHCGEARICACEQDQAMCDCKYYDTGTEEKIRCENKLKDFKDRDAECNKYRVCNCQIGEKFCNCEYLNANFLIRIQCPNNQLP